MFAKAAVTATLVLADNRHTIHDAQLRAAQLSTELAIVAVAHSLAAL
jgi:hypothetical protein